MCFQQIAQNTRNVIGIIIPAMVASLQLQFDFPECLRHAQPLAIKIGEKAFQIAVVFMKGIFHAASLALFHKHAPVVIAPAHPEAIFAVVVALE